MTVKYLKTLHSVRELERYQLFTIRAMPGQNSQLVEILYREIVVISFMSKAQLLGFVIFHTSFLYKVDRCSDSIPMHFKDTLMYVDPFTRQIFDYTTLLACDNFPRNVIELDPDSDDESFYFFNLAK